MKAKIKKLFKTKRAKYITAVVLLVVFAVALNYAFAAFTNRETKVAANITVAGLEYEMKIDDEVTTTVTVPANQTIVKNIEITSLNDIDSRYELIYIDIPGIIVEHSTNTPNPVTGTISSNGTITIRIGITNTTDSNIDIELNINAGYIHNTLDLINIIPVAPEVVITFNANNATLNTPAGCIASGVNRTCRCDIFNGTSCSIVAPTITRANFNIIGYNTSASANTSQWNSGATQTFNAPTTRTHNAITINGTFQETILVQNAGTSPTTTLAAAQTAAVNRGIPNYGNAPTNTAQGNVGANGVATGSGLLATRGSITGWIDNNEGLFSGTRATHEHATQESFYFRGHNNHVNNHVQFAGFYWRIIRIEGNGNIRLIYNGVVNTTNPPQWTGLGTSLPLLTGTATTIGIGTRQFNSLNSDTRYVGFRHGTSCTNYTTCHANTTPSTILGANTNPAAGSLNHWYLNNIINQGTTVTSRIATNTIFCGDRNINQTHYIGFTPTDGWYAILGRARYNKFPSLQCINRTAAAGFSTVPVNHDQYTMTGSGLGNQTLQYPVGLITVDEVAMTGSVYNTTSSTWVNASNVHQWTMTPAIFSAISGWRMVGVIHNNGSWFEADITNNFAVRPVISIRSDVRITNGNGTREFPYVIN